MLKQTITALAALAITAPAHAAIISSPGLVEISAPAVTVTADFLFNNGLPAQVIWSERQNVTLATALATDTGSIAAGTAVNSYFMALNVFNCCNNLFAAGSVTFDGKILGIVFQENGSGVLSPNYAATDFLGAPATTYHESGCLFCGFEVLGNQQGMFLDNLTINGNTVTFANFYSTPGDFARIITAPVPGPIVGAGLPGLLGLLGLAGWFWRRKKWNT